MPLRLGRARLLERSVSVGSGDWHHVGKQTLDSRARGSGLCRGLFGEGTDIMKWAEMPSSLTSPGPNDDPGLDQREKTAPCGT